jgi:hypothetical protein
MDTPSNASVNCQNIFKSTSIPERKAAFTQKMAELINQQEKAKHDYSP